MMETKIPVISDLYRCPKCKAPAARGNSYCRRCGIAFTEQDIEYMEAHIHTRFGALPWNLRDRYRCVHCQEWLCITDQYCRGCGDHIDSVEKSMMRARVQELAARNWPSVIGLAIFVVLAFFAIHALG